MSMRIVLELSDKDLERFQSMARKAMTNAAEAPPEQVIDAAHKLLDQVDKEVKSDFIRERLNQLKILIEMLEDEGWGMGEVGRKRVRTALAYFSQPEDLIPDHIPGLGFLDDAIMVELLCRELKPEMDAYRDFVQYRAAEARRLGKDPSELNRGDFLKARQSALLSRMRRRRRYRGSSGSGGKKSPFSLL